jgi:hypothetical protein
MYHHAPLGKGIVIYTFNVLGCRCEIRKRYWNTFKPDREDQRLIAN